LGGKSCEIKGGGQETAAMMLMLINVNNDCGVIATANINAAISWPQPFFYPCRLF